MRLPTRILICAAIVAAAVVAVSFGASAPAVASERAEAGAASDRVAEMSARKRHAKTHRSARLRVHRLSRRATEPPNPNRPYYRPVPNFYPFAQDRGYF